MFIKAKANFKIGQRPCSRENGGGMLFIVQPNRTFKKDGAAEIGQPWIEKMMKLNRKTARMKANGKTCYMVSVFGNVVCLSMISDASSSVSRAASIINFLESGNDVVNGVKLGLFLSGACREESLSTDNYAKSLCKKEEIKPEQCFGFFSGESSSHKNTKEESLNMSCSPDPHQNNINPADSTFAGFTEDRDRAEVDNGSSVITLDQLDIIGVVNNISDDSEEYDEVSPSLDEKRRVTSIASFFSDPKVIESRLARARERLARREEAREEQVRLRNNRRGKRRKISPSGSYHLDLT